MLKWRASIAAAASSALTPFLNVRSEEPLMAFGIFCSITTLIEGCIADFLNDLCSIFLCALEVFINLENVDEKALRRLPEFSRVLVIGTGTAHHHEVIA